MTDEVTAPAAGGESTTTGGMFDSLAGGAAPVTDNSVPTQQPTEAAPAEGHWFDSFQDEGLKEYLGSKGFKDPESIAKSYQNLEKMHGVPADELFRIRPDMEPEEMGKLYSKLGRPEAADGYTLKAGDGDVPELVEWLKGAAFESGMSDKAVNDLYAGFNEKVQGIADQQMEQIQVKNTNEVQDLFNSWGTKVEFNKNLVDRAGEHLGVTPEMLESIKSTGQSAAFMQMMAKVGSLLTEGKAIDGQNSGSMMGMTVSEAKDQIGALQRDQTFMKAYLDGSSPTHKSAVEQMTRLNKVIYNSQR